MGIPSGGRRTAATSKPDCWDLNCADAHIAASGRDHLERQRGMTVRTRSM